MSHLRSRPSPSGTAAEPDDSRLHGLLGVLVGGLTVARWLVPAEAAVLGDSLWLVQLWLLAGVIWAWDAFRRGAFHVRANGLDLALGILVGGHVLSALAVVWDGGDRRAAVNMLWEWVGLGVSFVVLRQVISTSADGRRLLLKVLAVAVAVAGLGLSQHYISFPRTVAEYDALRARQQALQAGDGTAGDQREELQRIETQFAEMGVPQEGTSRELFEQRLRSTEPFGTFALTNTLGGLLAVWLLVGLGMVLRMMTASVPRWRLLAAVVAVLIVLYCLILTKSRTAWVGLAAGFVVWGWLEWRGVSRRGVWWLLAVAAVALIVGLLGIAALSGGFDWAVLSGAPRSLTFRLQYWAGTWDVLREHPILGTGPGNFRPHYLQHKLPEASEEILDPHNFMLDVWTSGGLLGLIGLLLFLGWSLRKCLGRQRATMGADLSTSEPPQLWTPPMLGGIVGFAVVIVWDLLLGQLDVRMPLLLGGWLAVVVLTGSAVVATGVSTAALMAAGAALMVHLLGAGGIEMPTVVQTLLILIVAGTTVQSEKRESGSSPQRIPVDSPARGVEELSGARRLSPAVLLTTGGLLALLFIGCLITATVPVVYRQAWMDAGDIAYLQDHDMRKALALYGQAAQRDPLSPEPLTRMAELSFARWTRSSPATESEEFRRVVGFAEAAIERDRDNAHRYHQLGNWYRARFARTGEPNDARAAARQLGEAVARYPHQAGFLADHAEALADAEQEAAARQSAKEALQLDAINRAWGHRERYLPSATRERMEQLAQGESGPLQSGPAD